jgi:hypothetical protein
MGTSALQQKQRHEYAVFSSFKYTPITYLHIKHNEVRTCEHPVVCSLFTCADLADSERWAQAATATEQRTGQY